MKTKLATATTPDRRQSQISLLHAHDIRGFILAERYQLMKIRIMALMLLSLGLLTARSYSAELGLVRMGIVQGDVQIFTEDAGDWVPAAVNTPLTEEDRVWVPEGGRSELQVRGGIFIRLDEFTSFDLLSLEGTTYVFSVNGGRTYINNRSSGSMQLRFDTPTSTVTLQNSAAVMIDVEENGATEISVLHGYAYAETGNKRIGIPSGRTVRIREDLMTETYPLNAPDEWEEWNQDLDRRFSESDSSNRYLPEELTTYSHDLDSNGRWHYDNRHGYVWTPSVSISPNWAPYHDGRWVWIGGNYVWISSERWGWAPYHYGRWVFLRHGWCWIPPRRDAVHWGPGYVGWVHTPSYVSWVPLAPGETYYGYGNYGPGSVNLSIAINRNFPANRHYINRNARNAVKVMHRDTFLRGRHVAVPPRENPFHQKNAGIGPPGFKPDRETFAPVLKKVPAAKLPPQRIRTSRQDNSQKAGRQNLERRSPVVSPAAPTRALPPQSRETPRRIERQQKPESYRDGLRQREERLPPRRDQLRRELPVQENEPLTIITPTTSKRIRGETAPSRSRQQREPAAIRIAPQTGASQQRQPATIRVAPQPIASQPVAPTPVWAPSKPRQQEQGREQQGRSFSSQQQKRTPVMTERTRPDVSQTPVPATQPRQQTSQDSPAIRQPVPRDREREKTIYRPQEQQRQKSFRHDSQTIQQKQPEVAQPGVNQPAASRETTTTTTSETRQQRGNFEKRPTFQRSERIGDYRQSR